MHQKLMQAFMPAEKMIDMFTYKIISTRSIVNISEKVPSACEHFKFSLLQTYVYHEY
jgi:hypothetical protein